MISCPGCGTSNRRGSKFCGHCGQSLDPAPDIECPVCHRLNPSDSIYCAFCGTRVIPLPTDAAEASSPSADAQAQAESDSTQSREVPSWLYDTQETAQEAAPPTPALEPPPVPPPTHSSKYLEDIQGALPGTAGWLPVNAQAEPLPKVEIPTPRASRRQGCLTVVPLLFFNHLR